MSQVSDSQSGGYFNSELLTCIEQSNNNERRNMSEVSDSQSGDDFNSELLTVTERNNEIRNVSQVSDSQSGDDFTSELFWDDTWVDYGAEEDFDADFYEEEEESYEELHGKNHVARFLLILVFCYYLLLFLLNCF